MSLTHAIKVPLNKITHTVRASQSVIQYGVGAMVDFPDQTLMTAAPEYWKEKTIKIHDERLERLLNVNYFGMPGGKDEAKFSEGISYARFPEWYFCPKCRKFQPIHKWIQEYKKFTNTRNLENNPYMVKQMRCMKCHQELVVARIVVACKNGHIDDFPWIEWAHKRNMGGSVPVCANPSLTFKTGASSSEGLEGLVVTCENCHAKATLRKAFDPEIFAQLDETSEEHIFSCKGRHPWKNSYEKCSEYPRAMQRGSSSVYFPVTVSSLVIPPFSNLLTTKIEESDAFQSCRTTLSSVSKAIRETIIQEQISEWSNNIGIEIGVSETLVLAVLERKWNKSLVEDYNTQSTDYRAEEYDALNGSSEFETGHSRDFIRESMDMEFYDIPYIKNITLVHKIREVQALVGYSRLQPVEWSTQLQENAAFVSIKEFETNWYPAYEVRGEGIFIEFDQDALAKWIKADNGLGSRIQIVNNNFNTSFLGRNIQRKISAKFLLLHTLSHLLIKQLSFDCGYSIASLKERIYCSEMVDGKDMAGILIYTASGDSEGTLGGLVRQGRPDCLGHIFEKALRSAMYCSNDPVCILSKGQGRDSLNMAACHSCTLIPETSCEEFNIFLDRATVVGTYENRELGFYCEELFGIVRTKPSEDIAEISGVKQKKTKKCSDPIILLNTGLDLSEMSYPEIWTYLEDESMTQIESELISVLIDRSSELTGYEKPIYQEKIRLIIDGDTIEADLLWPGAHIMIFATDNEKNFQKAKSAGIVCYYLNDVDTSADLIITSIKENNSWLL